MNRSATFQTEDITSDCELVIFLGGTLNESSKAAYTVTTALIIINIISFPITSVLNALVIFAVKTKPRLKTMSNVALACLASTDFVMGVIGQPSFFVKLAVLLQGEGSSAYCSLLATSTNVARVLGLASILHLTLMNIERYIAIKHSLKYTVLVTGGRLARSSAFVWVVSLLFTVPLAIVDNHVYLVVSNLTGFLCMAIVIFCQIVFLQESRRQRKQIAACQALAEDRQKFLKDQKAFRLTTTIVFFLLLTYSPLGVVRILITNSFINSLNVAYITFLLAIFAVILNSLINPIIYCIRIRDFRVAFIEMLCRKTTVQAENTEKRIFGTLNKVAPHKAGNEEKETAVKRMMQEQQQQRGCEQINSGSSHDNGNNSSDNNDIAHNISPLTCYI